MDVTTANSTNDHSTPPLRVIFFGMTGAFSRAPLLALLRANATPPIPGAPSIEVCAVVLPSLAGAVTPRPLRADASDPHPPYVRLDRQVGVGRPRRARRAMLPMASSTPPAPFARSTPTASAASVALRTTSGSTPMPTAAEAPAQNILELAAARDIPIFEVARLNDPRTLVALAAFAPDFICVACFSHRLPSALLRLPRLGCLNVHPSLLPANRGPDPLFWTFHAGETTTGVTIHQMDAGLDTGPIVLQAAIAIPEGTGESALEAQLAALGGELLARAAAGLATSARHPTPQDAAHASAHPWPTADDYVIYAAHWSAQRAYRFACGVAARSQAITLVATDGARFQLLDPLAYSDTASVGAHTEIRALAHGEAWRLSGDHLWLRCSPGVLHARVAPNDDMADVS